MSWIPGAIHLLKESFGSETVRAFMYLAGLNVGRAAYRDHQHYLETVLSREKYLDLCLDLMRAVGWISGGSWHRENDKLFLTLENPFEHALGEVNFLRGVIAGCLSELEGKNYRCVQVGSQDKTYKLVVEPES